MRYDSSLDEKIFSKAWENDNERLAVSVYSYNKGAKKLHISRENKDGQGGTVFAKLGRLTKEEAEGILPLMKEALAHM